MIIMTRAPGGQVYVYSSVNYYYYNRLAHLGAELSRCCMGVSRFFMGEKLLTAEIHDKGKIPYLHQLREQL